MVIHTVAKCNYCNEKILLRFQLGYFDIPFDFCCPECGVSINGKYSINSGDLIINNAENIGECLDKAMYYGNFCAEFLNKKICKFNSIDDIILDGFGPFMSTFLMLGSNEEYFKIIYRIKDFLKFKYEKWKKIDALYDLYYNSKYELIQKKILEFSENYIIKNELDATISLHQITVIGISKIMPYNTLTQFTDLSKKIMLSEKKEIINDFISYLKDKIDLKNLSKKVKKTLSKWIDNFEKFIPIIILNYNEKELKIDREKYGISTISFEDIKSFYADTYELILEMITIPIGLNNAFMRSDFNKFNSNNSFEKLFKLQKSERIKYLIENEPFSKAININRNVRNAISHYDYDINKTTQKIIFCDKFKDKEKSVEMYLYDLATLCYDNIKIIIYLNELLYTLMKINYVNGGMFPNIKLNFK